MNRENGMDGSGEPEGPRITEKRRPRRRNEQKGGCGDDGEFSVGETSGHSIRFTHQITAGSGKRGELMNARKHAHYPHHHQIPKIHKSPEEKHCYEHNDSGIRKLPEFFKSGFFWIPWPGRFM